MIKRAITQMSFALKVEEAAVTMIALYFLSRFGLGLPWWAWALLFFSPDISMLGYLANRRIGAYAYNIVHHRAIALILFAIGLYLTNDLFTAIGVLLFAHSSFDRMMGYGLKFPDDFKHTSLGWMGNSKTEHFADK
jgi:hypothetical protein